VQTPSQAEGLPPAKKTRHWSVIIALALVPGTLDG
jgi:hypothetical protein